MAKRKNKTRGKLIEAAYYKAAVGKQINVLDIPKLWDYVEAGLDAGRGLEEVMAEAVAKYAIPIVGA